MQFKNLNSLTLNENKQVNNSLLDKTSCRTPMNNMSAIVEDHDVRNDVNLLRKIKNDLKIPKTLRGSN